MNACANCKHYIEIKAISMEGTLLDYDRCKAFIERVNPISGKITYEECAELRYKKGQIVDCGHYKKASWWIKFIRTLKHTRSWKRYLNAR